MEENKDLKQSLASAKGNIEIEGFKVPDVNKIKDIITEYRPKLGDEATDSLIYSLYEEEKQLSKEPKTDVRKK